MAAACGSEENAMPQSMPRHSVAQRLAELNAAAEAADREQAILTAMEDETPAIRDRAIRLATRYLEPAVLSGLVADETNAVRRNAALTALARQGPHALEQLQIMLRQDNHDVVMFALQMLSRIGDPTAAPSISPLVRHPSLNIAQSAVEALGQLRSGEAVPALLELLHGELWLQLAAIDALGAIGDARAAGPLLELVPDSIVAEPAVKALQRLAAPESLGPLLDRLTQVTEQALRDALLLALGVVIDLHPDPAPKTNGFAERILADGPGGIQGYLGQVLQEGESEGPTDGPQQDGCERGDRLRAAAAVVVVAGIEPVYPLVLSLIAAPEGAPWAEALFHLQPDRLGPALDRLLADPDPRVRRGALLASRFLAADLPRLLEHLGDHDAGVRAAACRALGTTGSVAVAPLLVERLRRGDPIEQSAASGALCILPPEAVAELDACLGPDTDEPILILALDVLSTRPDPRFEARILQLAQSRSTPLRRAALRAVAALPGPRTEVVLIRALADRHQPVQLEALELLVHRGGEKAVATLMALLWAGNHFRFHVIRALGHLQAPEAADKLVTLYPQCGPLERLEILWALIRIAPPGIGDFFRARLEEPETDIRRVATQGIADLADPANLDLLVALSLDPDWNVRNEAARGLGLLRLPACRAPLLTLVRDVESVVAQTARKALDRLAGDAVRACA